MPIMIPRFEKPKRSKMKRNNLEDQYQEKVFQWAAENEAIEPRLKFLFAIPNGGHRHPSVAVKLKRQGVKSGVPDICLPVPSSPFHSLWIEMKAERNKPSPKQVEWIDFLRAQGSRVAICWTPEEAIREIQNYLLVVTP